MKIMYPQIQHLKKTIVLVLKVLSYTKMNRIGKSDRN